MTKAKLNPIYIIACYSLYIQTRFNHSAGRFWFHPICELQEDAGLHQRLCIEP